MLNFTAVGTVIDTPELKASAKGTQYLKFKLETPAPKEGMWPKRIGVTVFGQQATALAAQIPTPGFLVSIVGEPQARGYVDKMGKAQGVLECVAREVRVHSAPYAQTQNQAWHPPGEQPAALVLPAVKEPNFGEDDIPFWMRHVKA